MAFIIIDSCFHYVVFVHQSSNCFSGLLKLARPSHCFSHSTQSCDWAYTHLSYQYTLSVKMHTLRLSCFFADQGARYQCAGGLGHQWFTLTAYGSFSTITSRWGPVSDSCWLV